MESMFLSYFICIALALLFYSVIDLFSNFRRFSQYVEILKKVGQVPVSIWWLILRYYIYHAPLILYNLTPIITLMAAMFTITRMARHNELLPLKACGVPMYSLIYPLIYFALISVMLMVVLQEIVIPSFSSKIEEMRRVHHGRDLEVVGIQHSDEQKTSLLYRSLLSASKTDAGNSCD